MLLQVACVFLIVQGTSLDYDDLVADVENTLDECFGIVQDVGRYVNEVDLLQGVSRRAEDENDNVATDVKLGACVKMIKAVDTYREKHTRFTRYQDFLRSEEKAYLHELLEPLSQKMGDLLYIASVDGDDISDFFTVYGNESPTLIIIESTNGTVFGGYTDKVWSKSVTWQTSSNAFLFRLRPSFEQYAIRTEDYATHSTDNVLRFGADLYLQDHALSNAWSEVKDHFYGAEGAEGYELNDGERYFQAKEWVAVIVEDL